jgi:hypothetical protein
MAVVDEPVQLRVEVDAIRLVRAVGTHAHAVEEVAVYVRAGQVNNARVVAATMRVEVAGIASETTSGAVVRVSVVIGSASAQAPPTAARQMPASAGRVCDPHTRYGTSVLDTTRCCGRAGVSRPHRLTSKPGRDLSDNGRPERR